MAEEKKENMLSLLEHNRRVFIDVHDMNNNGPLIRSIQNEQERRTFSLGLAKLLADFPQHVYEDINLTKEILTRFAILCGVECPAQPGWFYSITGNDGALWTLTLRDRNNEWYTFMASDDFLSVERCVPTGKHIIGLYGSAYTGKTPTMKKVFRALQKKYPEHAAVIESATRYDAKGIFFIGNAKVGIEGQGDPNSRLLYSIPEYVSVGCDIILVACHNFGMTVDAIDRFENKYQIDWRLKTTCNRSNAKACERANREQADQLVKEIEQIAANI